MLVRRFIYPAACVFIPCIVYQRILYRRWTPRERTNRANLAWRYAFILYLFLVMRAVGLGSVWDIAAYGVELNWSQINLIPFGSEGVRTYLLNIALFMPLGFLLPLLWGRYRSGRRTALTGFLLSLSIELCQIFNHRLTDIDDILMNVLGTALGYGLWRLLDRRAGIAPREAGIFPDRAELYLILAVLGSFFLFNWRLSVLMYR
ncbi:VanZ family protein [Eubacteriales bacterium OttesenSCG-928-A19]|nr:VanZ family protein [Eubacteriales bacterium OttesenSCG-928-A19]